MRIRRTKQTASGEASKKSRLATETVPTPTAGELLGKGCAIELIRDCGQVGLLKWDGKHATQALQVEYEGRLYAPFDLDLSISRALRLPTHAEASRSTRALFEDVQTLFMRHGVAEDSAQLLAYFVFSTWFVDCLPTAPCLWIAAPKNTDGASLLRLLASLSRRSLLLGEVTRASFQTLPMHLQPTLLIYQQRLPTSVQHLLWTSGTRGLAVTANGGLVDLFGARAICTRYSLEDFLSEGAILIPASPRTGPAPVPDEQELEGIAQDFQGRLLGYRLANHRKVRASTFYVAEFTAPTRALARSLGACIVDDPELQSSVVPLLRDRDDEVRAARSTGREAVVVEAALLHCHEGQKASVYVHEVREPANAILRGRGEWLRLDDREVGGILKRLGLYTSRLNGKGRGLRLLRSVRRKVHELAQEYGVQLAEDRVADCADCASVRRNSLGKPLPR